MRYIYVCNTAEDYISKIHLLDLTEEKIYINEYNCKVGPHGICRWKNKIIVANKYSDNIKIIDSCTNLIEECYYIGANCNDVKVFENCAYVACGDSNCVTVFNLCEKKSQYCIKCGIYPHSIEINEKLKLAIVTNMMDDSISIIDIGENCLIKTIKVGELPTKACILDNKIIMVCESFIGTEKNGHISFLSLDKGEVLRRVNVGKWPVDYYCDENTLLCFITNYGEGTVSVLDLVSCEEIKKIYTGGMPRAILKKDSVLYVGDNGNNCIKLVDIVNEQKAVIPIGKEPTGMTLI